MLNALLIGFPVEFLLATLFLYPLDTGIPGDAPFYARMLFTLSAIVHWPAFVALDWLISRHASAGIEMLAVFAIGYTILTLLLLLVILLLRWARQSMRNLRAA